MPELYRFRDRLPKPGEGKQPRAELSATIDGPTAELYIYDVIDSWGGYWGISAAEVAEALTTLPSDVETILLRINSPGGEVYEAIAIKNLLAGHGAKIVALVDGIAASAASFIATAADETVMGENTELMIHDAHVIARGNAEAFRGFADDLDRVSDNIAAIYAKKSTATAATRDDLEAVDIAGWREVMKAEKWYSAQDAVDAGLADRVGTAEDSADGSTQNSMPARQLHAVALGVVRGTATQWTPDEVLAPAAIATPPTKEQEGHQTETAPSGTAESGASRSEVTPPPAPSTKENVMQPSMSIEEREARITEIDARLTDIDAASAGDVLSTEDRAEWDALLDEKNGHLQAVSESKARRQVLAAFAANPAAQENEELVNERRPISGAPAVHIKPENIYDFGAIRNSTSTVEQRNKKMNEHALRAVEISKFPGVEALGSSPDKAKAHVTALLEREGNDESGNDAVLAERVLRSGSELYNRAFGKAFAAATRFNPNPMAGLNHQEVQALTLGSDPDGGYAVPFQLDPTVILTSAGSTNPMRKLARVVEITGKKWEGLTSAGSVATREGETDEAALSNPTFGQPVVETSRVDVFVDFSIALESDWSKLSGELSTIIADALDAEEATSFITGAGTALTTGGVLPQGILTGLSATTTSYVLTAGTGVLARTDLYNVLDALPDRFDTDDVAWIGSRSFFTNTRGLETVGDTTPLSDDQAKMLVGVPKNRASGMPAFATASNSNLAIYGNIRKAFIIADRIGFNLALIPIMTGANGRPNGKRGVWGYRYNGSKLINPNAARLLRMK